MRPMLACKLSDVRLVKYPVMATPKLDGIRCLIQNGRAVSRTLKPIPNKHVREWLEEHCVNGWDGELMLPAPYTFQDISSTFMSQNETPPESWFYGVFDWQPVISVADASATRCAVAKDAPAARARYAILDRQFADNPTAAEHALIVGAFSILNEGDLLAYEGRCLKAGCEGVMLRAPDSPYKYGRSTAKEGYLFKLKRFEDSEAEITGAIELEHNENAATSNELGLTKRSSAKAGQRAGDMLGALQVRDVHTGVEFEIGTGFTQEQRVNFWRNRIALNGQVVKYKFFPHGVKDKPRHPTFLGFRSREDM